MAVRRPWSGPGDIRLPGGIEGSYILYFNAFIVQNIIFENFILINFLYLSFIYLICCKLIFLCFKIFFKVCGEIMVADEADITLDDVGLGLAETAARNCFISYFYLGF